jgi:hypothetical protein
VGVGEAGRKKAFLWHIKCLFVLMTISQVEKHHYKDVEGWKNNNGERLKEKNRFSR